MATATKSQRAFLVEHLREIQQRLEEIRKAAGVALAPTRSAGQADAYLMEAYDSTATAASTIAEDCQEVSE